MALSDVSNILWRERRLLEQLIIRLEVQPPEPRTREIDSLRGELKRVELERAIVVADAAHQLGLPASPTLRDLAACTPPPWEVIFTAHRQALVDLVREIHSMPTAETQNLSDPLTMRQNLSSIEDADVTQVMMQLSAASRIRSSHAKLPPRQSSRRSPTS